MKAEKHEKNKAQQEKEQKNEDDPKFIMEIRASLHFVHFVHSISLSSVLINYDAVVKDH